MNKTRAKRNRPTYDRPANPPARPFSYLRSDGATVTVVDWDYKPTPIKNKL